MRGQKILFSKNRDDWETPRSVFDSLNAEFHFNLDPCASESNTKCERFFTVAEDGLAQDWTDATVFINPPYSATKKWIEKAYIETRLHNATCVLLVAARTDTKWFHTYVYNVPGVEVRFIKGRIKFELDGQPIFDKKGKPQAAPFPSMVLIFTPT